MGVAVAPLNNLGTKGRSDSTPHSSQDRLGFVLQIISCYLHLIGPSPSVQDSKLVDKSLKLAYQFHQTTCFLNEVSRVPVLVVLNKNLMFITKARKMTHL